MAAKEPVLKTSDGVVSDSDAPIAPAATFGANRNLAASKSFFSSFDPNDEPAERRLIMKLDFFILAYAFIGFWVLYIDRGLLINAYISGLREIERWIREGDVDGFNLGHIVVPGAWEDVVEFLTPELQKRGWLGTGEYPVPGGTARENLYATPGDAHLRAEHPGHAYKFRAKAGTDE